MSQTEVGSKHGLTDIFFRRGRPSVAVPPSEATVVGTQPELDEGEFMRGRREKYDQELLEREQAQLLADIADGFVERAEAGIVPTVNDHLPGDAKAHNAVIHNGKFITKQGGAFIAYSTLTDAPTQEERRLKDVTVIWQGVREQYKDPVLLLYLLARQQAALNSRQNAALFSASPFRGIFLQGIKVSLLEGDPDRGKAKPLIVNASQVGDDYEAGVLNVGFFVAPELTAAFLDEVPSLESQRVFQARQELRVRVASSMERSPNADET